MREGLSGGCRAGLTLKRYTQLGVFAVQPVHRDAAAVWLVEDGVHQVFLLRAPVWCPSGGGGTREARGTAMEKPGGEQQHAQAHRGTRYRASNSQIRQGRTAARSSTSQESAEPLCTRSKARTGRFLRGKLISDHGLFSSLRGSTRSGSRGVFTGMHRASNDWILARAPASPALGLHRHGP